MRHKWINVYKALGAVPGTQITLGNAGYSYVMTIIYAFSWVKAESAIRERRERRLGMGHWGLWQHLLHNSVTSRVHAKPLPLKHLASTRAKWKRPLLAHTHTLPTFLKHKGGHWTRWG